MDGQETQETYEVDQDQQASDWIPEGVSQYEQDYELVDDSDQPVEGNKEPSEPVQSQAQPPEAKPEEEPQGLPEGFMKQFYEEGEDGTYTFNSDKAIDVFAPKSGAETYKYRGREYKQVDPNYVPEPQKPAWEQQIETYNQSKKDISSNMFLFADKFKEFLGTGSDVNTAYTNAVAHVNNVIQQEFSNMETEHQKALFKAQNGTYEEQQRQKELDGLSYANDQIIAGEVGGTENFNMLFREPDSVGQINELFDMFYPEYQKGHTQKEVTDAVNSWWKNITSNINSYRTMTRILKNHMFVKNHHHFTENRVRRALQPKGKTVKPSRGYNKTTSTGTKSREQQQHDAYFSVPEV